MQILLIGLIGKKENRSRKRDSKRGVKQTGGCL